MAEETESILRQEIVEHLRAWFADRLEPCGSADGLTKSEILKLVRMGDFDSSFASQEVGQGVDMLVEVAPPQQGRRNLVRLRDTKQFLKQK